MRHLPFCAIFCSALFIGTSHAMPPEVSVRGVKLGMPVQEALATLSKEFDGKKVWLDRYSTTTFRSISVGSLRNCEPDAVRTTKPCVAFKASFMQTTADEKDAAGVIWIALAQFFDQPVDPAAFEAKLVEAYGPATSKSGYRLKQFARHWWLWLDEKPDTLNSDAWTDTIGIHNTKLFKSVDEPILRIMAWERRGLIVGMEVDLVDPRSIRETWRLHKMQREEWRKKRAAEKQQRAVDAAKQLKLR